MVRIDRGRQVPVTVATPRSPWAAWLAWALAGLTMLTMVPAFWVGGLLWSTGREPRPSNATLGAVVLVMVSAATVGALVAGRRPRHPVGWLLFGVGLGLVVTLLVQAYVGYGLLVLPYLLAVPAAGRLAAGAGSLGVAAATLAAVAAFSPLRRRVHALADRRFNRRRHDAARTIADFSARLRDEIDLDTLMAELQEVVEETMQPTRASLWLRPQALAMTAAGRPMAGRPH